MKQQQQTPDFAALRRYARSMSPAALAFARQDCWEAAQAAEELERAGCRVSKTGGYYRDEGTVYAAELRRRANAAPASALTRSERGELVELWNQEPNLSPEQVSRRNALEGRMAQG